MSTYTPLAVPGIEGRTILVTRAGSPAGVAQSLVLLASGARVLAIDEDPRLPAELQDAGTGLPGALDYRGAGAGWAAVADWVGERHAGVHGVVLNATPEAADLLYPHLAPGAAVVAVGCRAELRGCRCNTVEYEEAAAGLDMRAAERVAAVVGFLVSDISSAVRGARLVLQP